MNFWATRSPPLPSPLPCARDESHIGLRQRRVPFPCPSPGCEGSRVVPLLGTSLDCMPPTLGTWHHQEAQDAHRDPRPCPTVQVPARDLPVLPDTLPSCRRCCPTLPGYPSCCRGCCLADHTHQAAREGEGHDLHAWWGGGSQHPPRPSPGLMSHVHAKPRQMLCNAQA